MTEAEFYGEVPRKRVGAGALITDRAGRVLLVEPTYKSTWEVPGGVVEADETAFDACRRECREELGIDVRVGRLLVVEHQCDGGNRGDSIMFIYDGGVVPENAKIRLPIDELRSHRFVEPATLGEVTAQRLARRLRFALQARAESRVIELVDGRPTDA
jgi:ADP-ribose pyrophosphatase YjhB (NUDIX family)